MSTPDPTPVNEAPRDELATAHRQVDRSIRRVRELESEVSRLRADLEEACEQRGALWELLKDSVRMVKRCEQSMDLLNTERLQLRRDNAALRENLACERPRCTNVDERGRRCLEARTDRHVHVYDEASWIVLHNAARPDTQDTGPWGHWCCRAGAVASPQPCPHHGTDTDSPAAKLATVIGQIRDAVLQGGQNEASRAQKVRLILDGAGFLVGRQEPGQGSGTEVEPERVEWNPTGYDWHPATVIERRNDTHLVIRLDDNRQELLVETRNCRPATEAKGQDADSGNQLVTIFCPNCSTLMTVAEHENHDCRPATSEGTGEAP